MCLGIDGFEKTPPAGSDSGLRPPQGQSHFFEPINPLYHPSFIQIQRIEFFFIYKIIFSKGPERGTPAGSDSGLRPPQGQSRFSTPTTPILYSICKIRKMSIFNTFKLIIFLKGPEGDNNFPQRTGEGRKNIP